MHEKSIEHTFGWTLISLNMFWHLYVEMCSMVLKCSSIQGVFKMGLFRVILYIACSITESYFIWQDFIWECRCRWHIDYISVLAMDDVLSLMLQYHRHWCSSITDAGSSVSVTLQHQWQHHWFKTLTFTCLFYLKFTTPALNTVHFFPLYLISISNKHIHLKIKDHFTCT